MYAVEVALAARRQLRKLSPAVQRRIVEKLENLGTDPRPSGVKKLSAGEGLFRIRVGDYRIVYRIDDQVLQVLVVQIGDRKWIYQKLLGKA